MQQAINAAQVDECAVGHEAADRARDRVASLQGLAEALGEAARLLFEDHAAIDHHIFIGDVQLGDAAGDLGADQLFQLRRVVRAAARGGHEGPDAHIHAEAALDDLGDRAHDGGLVGEGGFQGRPVARLGHLEARKLVVVLGVAAGNRDRETVARLDLFGIVLEGRTGQNALGFVADVEKNLIGGERDDGALQLLCARFGPVRVAVLEGAEQVGEGLLGLVGLCNGRGRLRGLRNGFGHRLGNGLGGLRGGLGGGLGDELRGCESLGDGNGSGGWLGCTFQSRFKGWRGSRLGGGQGFFGVVVCHNGLTFILPYEFPEGVRSGFEVAAKTQLDSNGECRGAGFTNRFMR